MFFAAIITCQSYLFYLSFLAIVCSTGGFIYDASTSSVANKHFPPVCSSSDKHFPPVDPAIHCNLSCPCPNAVPTIGIFSAAFVTMLKNTYTTAETLFRGFAFGFGARMLKFAIVHQDEDLSKLRDRMLKSAVVGLSLSSLIVGMSIFMPARYRSQWFEN